RNNTNLSFEKIIYDILKEGSNINHTCPYDNDVILKNLVFKEEYLRVLPLPTGEYKIQIIIGTDNTWVTNVKMFIYRKEDLIK
ncbi:hypothetical protein KR222_002587, partial [Zaprionus bogoriensis]